MKSNEMIWKLMKSSWHHWQAIEINGQPIQNQWNQLKSRNTVEAPWKSIETNEDQLKPMNINWNHWSTWNQWNMIWTQWKSVEVNENLLKLQTIEQGNRLHNGSTSSLQQIRIACREDLAQCTHGVADTTQLELRKPLQLRGVAGEEVHDGRGSAPLMSRQLAIWKMILSGAVAWGWYFKIDDMRLDGNRLKSMEIDRHRWASMNIDENRWNRWRIDEESMNIDENRWNRWKSMKTDQLNENNEKSMTAMQTHETNKNKWKRMESIKWAASMEINETQWNSTKLNESEWKSMKSLNTTSMTSLMCHP